jgi:hypothetical protein
MAPPGFRSATYTAAAVLGILARAGRSVACPAPTTPGTYLVRALCSPTGSVVPGQQSPTTTRTPCRRPGRAANTRPGPSWGDILQRDMVETLHRAGVGFFVVDAIGAPRPCGRGLITFADNFVGPLVPRCRAAMSGLVPSTARPRPGAWQRPVGVSGLLSELRHHLCKHLRRVRVAAYEGPVPRARGLLASGRCVPVHSRSCRPMRSWRQPRSGRVDHMDLRLRRTEIPTGTPLDDDYCVVLDGHTIGRIVKVQRAGGAWTWLWSFLISPSSAGDRGDAETLDEAKAAFRARSRRSARSTRGPCGACEPPALVPDPRTAGGDPQVEFAQRRTCVSTGARLLRQVNEDRISLWGSGR